MYIVYNLRNISIALKFVNNYNNNQSTMLRLKLTFYLVFGLFLITILNIQYR